MNYSFLTVRVNLRCLTAPFSFLPFPWRMEYYECHSRQKANLSMLENKGLSTEAETKASGHRHHESDTGLGAESPLLLK